MQIFSKTYSIFTLLLLLAVTSNCQNLINFTKYNKEKGLPSNVVTTVEQDASGKIWAGTDAGLAKQKSEEFITHIKDKSITAIASDETGFLWIGTTEGLIKYEIDSNKAETFTHIPSDANSLSENHITDIELGKEGVVWVVTMSGGVNAYYRQSNVFEHYTTESKGISSNKTTDIAIVGEYLIVATADAGLSILNTTTGELKICRKGTGDNNLPSDEINALYYDDGQVRLWIGTTNGLACLPQAAIESGSYSFINFPKKEENKTLSGNDITAISIDRTASIWVGTKNNGLNRMVFQSKTNLNDYIIQKYEKKDEKEASISSNTITVIKKESSGRLWVGTDNQLNKFSPSMQTYMQVEAFFTNVFKGFDDFIFGKKDTSKTETNPSEKETTSISGVFMYNKNNPGAEVEMLLLDEEKKEIDKTQTDQKGQFRFEGLPKDETYIILVKTKDATLSPYAKIYITNENGEKVARMIDVERGYFKFTTLPRDEYAKMEPIKASDADLLTVNINGRLYEKIPGDYPAGVEVMIVNDAGEILYVTRTEEGGYFTFKRLPPDKQYLFKLHAEDSEGTLVILDDNGNEVKKIDKNTRSFAFQYLPPDAVMITLLNEDDVELVVRSGDNFIISNVYYDYNKYNINKSAAYELDKLIAILKKNPNVGVQIEAHTDSRGSDNYNKTLSERRSQAAVEYIVSKGVPIKKVTGKGYGAEEPVNNCTKGVDCTEKEHAKNRRTEFKIMAM